DNADCGPDTSCEASGPQSGYRRVRRAQDRKRSISPSPWPRWPDHLFVDVLPVLDRSGQHRLLDTIGESADDGLDETLALLLGVDLADQRVRLTEVVILGVQAVGAADELTVGLPAVVDRALRLLVGA